MLTVGILQDVDAARHFIAGYINRYCFHILDIIYGVLRQHCDKTGLSNKFKQCVYFIEFNSDIEAIEIRCDAVEGIAGLQAL